VKIIGLEQGNNAEPVYKVHYAGWHRRYDESIPLSQALTRFKAIAKENVDPAKNHLFPEKVPYQSRKKSTSKKNRGRGSSNGTTPEDVRSTIRPLSRDVSMESDQSEEQSVVPVRNRQSEETSVSYEFVPVARLHINLTMALKATLYDDSELIRKMQLTKVPARLSAARIVAMYGEQKKNDISMECALGILDYFNATLGTQLLYKPERPQYENLIARLDEKERKEMSKYYGFVHLLRLFVRFTSMLADTPQLNERTIKGIIPRIADFVTWLDENCDRFFDVNLDYETKSQ